MDEKKENTSLDDRLDHVAQAAQAAYTCRRQSEQAVLLQEQQPGLQWLVRLGCLLGL